MAGAERVLNGLRGTTKHKQGEEWEVNMEDGSERRNGASHSALENQEEGRKWISDQQREEIATKRLRAMEKSGKKGSKGRIERKRTS